MLISLVVLVLLCAPTLGFAGDDLSASPSGKHDSGRLHHAPDRVWRTTPTTLAPSLPAPAITEVERVSPVETVVMIPLLVRAPFVPPRG